MTDMASFTATVRGRVQGVFFRAFTQRCARQLAISGYVRNMHDGSVEVRASGKKTQLELFLSYLSSGPPASNVTEVVVDWLEYKGEFNGFHIEY